MSMPAMSNSNAGCKPVKLAFKAEIEISAFFGYSQITIVLDEATWLAFKRPGWHNRRNFSQRAQRGCPPCQSLFGPPIHKMPQA